MIQQANLHKETGATFGSLWNKIIDVRDSFPSMFDGCSIFVADNPFKKLSAVDRIARAIPALAHGVYKSQTDSEMLKRAITNVPALVNVPDPSPNSGEWLSAATEIANGIPSRFPAIFATLTLQWAENVCRLPDQRDASIYRIATTQSNNPLTLGVRAIKNVDELWLTALVDLGDVSEKTQHMPKTPPTIQSIIDELGGVWWSMTTFVPDETERDDLRKKAAQARLLTDRYRETALDVAKTTALEMRDAQIMQDEAFADMDRPRSELDHVTNFRAEFVKTFRRRGYIYDKARSQARIHVMSKQTHHDNVIEIIADAGGFGKPRICSFDLVGRGLGWETDRATLFRHSVLTTADWVQANRNAAIVLSPLEDKFTAEIDGLYGRSPPWFLNCGRTIHP